MYVTKLDFKNEMLKYVSIDQVKIRHFQVIILIFLDSHQGQGSHNAGMT